MPTTVRILRQTVFPALLGLFCLASGYAAERNILQDGSFDGLRHFRGLDTWRLAAGQMEVRKERGAADRYFLHLEQGAVVGQSLEVPAELEFAYTCILQVRSEKGAEVVVDLVSSGLPIPRNAAEHKSKTNAAFVSAESVAGPAPIDVKPSKGFARHPCVLKGKFAKQPPRAFSLRLIQKQGDADIDLVVIAKGTSDEPEPIRTSLRVVNQKGNVDFVLLKWEQEAGTYAVEDFLIEYREKGAPKWLKVPNAGGPGAGAVALAGCGSGKSYEFRCQGRSPRQTEELKKEPDATAAVGTPRTEITFGVNPYPLADMFGDPTPDQPVQIIRNEIGWVEFCLYDQDQKRVKSRQGTWGDLVLEVPPGLRVVGANFTANRFYPPGHPVKVWEAGRAQVAGETREIHYVRVDNPKVMTRGRSYFSPLDVYFEAGENFSGGRLSWWCVRDGQAGPRTEVSVNVLPPIEFAGDSPFEHWLGFSDSLTGDLTRGEMPREPSEILARRTSLFAKISVHEDYGIRDGWPEAASWAARHPGISVSASKRSRLTEMILAGYYYRNKPHPPEKLDPLFSSREEMLSALWRDAQGKTVYDRYEDDPGYRGAWNYWCNEYLRRTNTSFFKKVLELEREHCPASSRSEIAREGIKFSTVWDNEMDLGDKVLDHCFCERCLKSFARRAGIPAEGLTPDKVLKDHQDEWRRFRNWQMAEVVRMWDRMNKELDPRLQSCLMFSGNAHHENIALGDATKYVDEFLIEQTCSGHFYFDELAKFMSGATKPVTGFSMECTPNGRLLPQNIYQSVMASAAHGCTGFMHERIGQICGERIALCAKANREIKTLWPYFHEGRQVDGAVVLEVLPLRRDRVYIDGKAIETDLSSPAARVRHLVHQKERAILIDLFNYNRARPIFVLVSVPGLPTGRYRVVNPSDGSVLTRQDDGKETETWEAADLAEGFVWKVERQDVSFVLITPQRVRKQGTQPASRWAEERHRASTGGRDFPPIRSGEVTVDWEDVESDGAYEIRVKTPAQTVSISLAEGGQLWPIAPRFG